MLMHVYIFLCLIILSPFHHVKFVTMKWNAKKYFFLFQEEVPLEDEDDHKNDKIEL